MSTHCDAVNVKRVTNPAPEGGLTPKHEVTMHSGAMLVVTTTEAEDTPQLRVKTKLPPDGRP